MIKSKLAPETPANGPDLVAFIEQAPATVAILDREMRYLAASRRWVADFRPEPPDLVGLSHFDVFPRLPPHMKDVLKLALAGRTLRQERDALERSDGRTQYFTWEVQPWRDARGEIAGVVVFALDVTAEVTAAQALAESEARFRQMAEVSADILCRTDRAGVVQYVSPACALLGYTPEELVGRRVTDTIVPEEAEGVDSQLRKAVETPDAPFPEFGVRRVRCKDGRVVWLEGRPVRILDDQGDYVGIMSSLRDVTERERLAQQLRESEERYRQLAARVPDIIVRYDLKGVLEYVSPAVARFGYEPEALIGRHIAEFGVDGAPQLVALAAFRKGDVMPTGRQNEFRLKQANGEPVWVQGNPAPVFDDAGEPIGVVSVVRDISEQRQIEAQLAESEARFRLLAERGGDISVQTDAGGVLVYVSPSCTSVLGYAAEEMIGRSALDFIHLEQHGYTNQRMAELYGNRQAATHERPVYRAVKKDGCEIWLEGISTVTRDESGAVTGAVSSLRDVTERRAAAEALALSERKWRGLFELSPLGIALTDVDGRYLEFNEAFRQITGYRDDELKALDYWTLTPPEYAGAEARQQEVLDRTGRYGPFEKQYRRKDGSRIPIRLNGIRFAAPDGQVLVWSIVEDITDQLQSEAVLIEARAAAEAAAVAKSEFLANMSHEIRTPLTGVVGFAGLLETMDELPADARRYARRISTSAETLLAVVNDVLDFSKLEAAQMELDPHAFDAAELAETVSDLVRDRIAGKDIRLVTCLHGPAPPRLVADSARLRQVLLNFLTNAAKFTEEGSITVTTAYDAATERLGMSVRDTGVGVPPELADRLFQRFSQVDASSTRRYGGTGLGLAICKSLIEVMGGDIGFTSSPGQGSTFWFEIVAPPASEADELPPAPCAADVEMGRTTILVVDDVTVNRELVAAMLGPFDVTLVEADSGASAVKAAMGARFDLILMDVQMPGMDGMAATKAIRANSDLNRTTPILAVSANVLPEQVAAAREAGMNDHIAKPLDPAELIGKIAHWAGASA